MRISKKQVIKYLKRKMDEIDRFDFYEFQSDGNNLKNAIKTLENWGIYEYERNK